MGSGNNLVAIEVATLGTLSQPCLPRDVTDCGACLSAWSYYMERSASGGLCISASGNRVPTVGR